MTVKDYEDRLQAFERPGKYPDPAIRYAKSTWLKWKEKIVSCFVDEHRHFGHFTTSIVESLHAVMKRFITACTGDLATAFRKLDLFWRAQYASIQAEQLSRINKVPTSSLTFAYSIIRTSITPIALINIIQEEQTLDRTSTKAPPIDPCGPCRIKVVMGLPCKHTIWKRIYNKEPLQLADIDPHWWWQRETLRLDKSPSFYTLEPQVIRAKGRPKGSLGLEHRAGITSSRRDPLLVERVLAAEKAEASEATGTARPGLPPPSTAPPAVDTAKVTLSTTALGLQRLQGGDTYDAGTKMQRAYQRAFSRLEDVDDDAITDEDMIEGEADEIDEADGEDLVLELGTPWASQQQSCMEVFSQQLDRMTRLISSMEGALRQDDFSDSDSNIE